MPLPRQATGVIGAWLVNLTFYGAHGHIRVEHLFHKFPGFEIEFLLVVSSLIFVLAFFLTSLRSLSELSG